MKKVFAALAVVAVCCAAPAVHAAEGEASYVFGNVELYGAVKVSVDMIKTGATSTSDNQLTRVSSNSSRIGVRGKEDLGDGLSAVFQMELGVNYDGSEKTVVSSVKSTSTGTWVSSVATKDTSVNTLSMRNSYAGLRHEAIGMIALGIHDTPYKMSTGGLDLFGDSMGDYNAFLGNVNGTANFDLRAKDEILYFSPDWAGFTVNLSRSVTGSETDNATSTTNPGNASLTSAAVAWKGGPVYATAAYESHRNGYTSWDSSYKNKAAKAGVGLTFGGTKINAVYEKITDDKPNSDKTRPAIYLGVSQTFGKETIKLAYAKAGDGEDPATKTGAHEIVAGIDHKFSKRTTVYALYAKTTNDDNATYGLGQSGAGGAYTPAAGLDPSVFSIGINHSF